MSVPNQCSAEGGFRRWTGARACGSTVPSQGANSAASTIIASTAAPATAVGWRRKASRKRGQDGEGAGAAMSVADARIEQPVGQVHGEVDQHVDAGEQQDHALDDGVIAAQD